MERAKNVGREVEFVGRVGGEECLFGSGIEDCEGVVGPGRGLVGIMSEERSRGVRPLSVPGVVLLEPEDEIEVFRVLLDEEEPFLEILEP